MPSLLHTRPVHSAVPLIGTMAAALGLALVLGFGATALRLPALVGYLFAGVLIGPHAPGFVADVDRASQLAETGVMLLMFGVGLHFSLGVLVTVRRIAIPGAVVRMAVATATGAGLALWWGWSAGGALVSGISLSVASTVVLRALEPRGVLESQDGRIAAGWLIVEDPARTPNPGIPVVVRALDAEEAALLPREGARRAVHARSALAGVMTRDVLALTEQPQAQPAESSRPGPAASTA